MGIVHPTGNDILQAALLQAEMDDSNRVTTDMGLTWVNEGLAELHDLLVGAFEDYFIKEHSFAASDLEQVLPDDFLKAVKVYDDSTGRPLKRFTLNELRSSASSPAYWPDLKYRLWGGRIKFNHAPPDSVTMYYIPQFTPLTNLAQRVVYSVPVSWVEFVIQDVTARALAAEESSFVFYEGRKEQIRNRIEVMAEDRDAGEEMAIQDIDPDEDADPDYW